MQRLFSTFASGWPGAGLLFQRLLTATLLFHSVIAHLGQINPPAATVLRVIGAAAGILLVLGLWTPVAGMIVAIAQLGLLFLHAGDSRIHVALAILGATLAMIGPGAWSIDARLFGRKQIEIPGRLTQK